MTKKIVTVLLAVLMVMSLAACGQEQAQSLATDGTDAAQTDAGDLQPEAQAVSEQEGIFIEPVTDGSGMFSVGVYINALPYDEDVFTDSILSLKAGGNTFKADFADTTTDRGMVVPEGLYAPILYLEYDGATKRTSYYVKDKSTDGAIIMVFDFAGDMSFAEFPWDTVTECTLTRAADEIKLDVLKQKPLPEAAPAQLILPEEVYSVHNLLARGGDAEHFVPASEDWGILIDTNSERTQTAYLSSFNSDGSLIEVLVREVYPWERVSNMDEVLLRNDAVLVDDAMYYRVTDFGGKYKWGQKADVFEGYIEGYSVGYSISNAVKGEKTYYYTKPLTEEQSTFFAQNDMTSKSEFKILDAVQPPTDDYYVRRNTDQHTEKARYEVDYYMDTAYLLHEEYTYTYEYLDVFDEDGYRIQSYFANICVDDRSADEYEKSLKYLAKQDCRRIGNVFLFTYDETEKAHKYDVVSNHGDGFYISKPLLTQAQISELFENGSYFSDIRR